MATLTWIENSGFTKTNEPNLGAKLIAKYHSIYSFLVLRLNIPSKIAGVPYTIAETFCNHPYRIPVSSKDFVECLTCYKHFQV